MDEGCIKEVEVRTAVLLRIKSWKVNATGWLRFWRITRGWVRKAGFVGIIIMEE